MGTSLAGWWLDFAIRRRICVSEISGGELAADQLVFIRCCLSRHATAAQRAPTTTRGFHRIACAFVTGLIYVVIIALWAAVLIPIWLRRHDQISEVRSTARFSSAMKSLGKQGAADARFEGAPVAFNPSERAREIAAKRRAIIMGVLSGTLALMLVLAIAGIVPRWAPIVLAAIVLAYVIAAAATSSQRSSRSDARVRDARRVREVHDDYSYEALDDDREIAYADEVAEVAYPRSRGTRPASKRSRDAQVAAAMDDFLSWDPWEGETEEQGWSAVPTTLPTYVNAPRATRVRRPIERDRDWSGEAMVEAARTMRRPRITVDDLADDKYSLEASTSVTRGDDTTELPAVTMDEGYDQTPRAAGE